MGRLESWFRPQESRQEAYSFEGAGNVLLPPVKRIRLSPKIREEIGRHARVVLESHLYSEKSTTNKFPKVRPKFSVPNSAFKELNPEDGWLKDKRRGEEAIRISKKYGFDSSPREDEAVPFSSTRLQHLLKGEYPGFLKSHKLQDSPEAYGMFFLGILHSYASSLTKAAKDLGRHSQEIDRSTGRTDSLQRMVRTSSALVPKPFSLHVPMSEYAKEGDPAPTRENVGTGRHLFLEIVKSASPWYVKHVSAGEPFDDEGLRNSPDVTRMFLLKEIMEKKGLKH